MNPQMHTEPAPSPLELVSTPSAAPSPLPGNVLACMEFGAAVPFTDDPRIVPVSLEVLESAADIYSETWTSPLPVVTGLSEGVRFAENGEVLFGWLHVPEECLSDVEEASYRMHLDLHGLMRRRGFPHWLRAWNYLSRINEGEGDAERYRQFTVGRHRALAEAFAGTPEFDSLLPAATGIGMRGASGLTVCFFAARTPGIQVENPRQVSAFRYPRDYGPRSPSFSRATLYQWAGRSTLFVSGTASIVGHATLHPGNAVAQFEETLANLDALVRNATREHSPASAHAFTPKSFKLYVRDPQHLHTLGYRWRSALAEHAPTVVLVGDLCRSDLLIEVEAIYERDSA
jgi:chorismate lyase/3-hydroxybenzoate synthase